MAIASSRAFRKCFSDGVVHEIRFEGSFASRLDAKPCRPACRIAYVLHSDAPRSGSLEPSMRKGYSRSLGVYHGKLGSVLLTKGLGQHAEADAEQPGLAARYPLSEERHLRDPVAPVAVRSSLTFCDRRAGQFLESHTPTARAFHLLGGGLPSLTAAPSPGAIVVIGCIILALSVFPGRSNAIE